jgi:putative oxidoreductase
MIPERYASVTYALFRIVFGYVFFIFGLQKFGLLGGQMVELASLQGGAAIIESVGGFLIMIGLLTRPAAFIASGEMAVAYFYIHVMMMGMPPGGPGFPTGVLIPQANRGVDAVLFCFAFLYIASRGAGILSVDGTMGRGGSRRR